jgi:hypothetical protein
MLIGQPCRFASPKHVFFGLPNVGTTTRKPKRGKTHRLESHVASENDQISPGDGIPVLAFQRPEQPTRFIKVGVVGPTI